MIVCPSRLHLTVPSRNYFLVMTTYDTDGRESGLSAELEIQV